MSARASYFVRLLPGVGGTHREGRRPLVAVRTPGGIKGDKERLVRLKALDLGCEVAWAHNLSDVGKLTVEGRSGHPLAARALYLS